MAGDPNITERVVRADEVRVADPSDEAQERTIHRYGRIAILAAPGVFAEESVPEVGDMRDLVDDPTEVETLGLAAQRLRQSADYRRAKENRPRDGEEWDMGDCTSVVPTPPQVAERDSEQEAGPTSSYLEGSVAVGIVIVQGPTAALSFSEAEVVKVVAEVQNGLGWFATANPLAGISFSYDIQNVNLSVQADPSAADLEALWRDPAMGALGYSADWNGVGAYVEDIRSRYGTRWTYCAFFTKYPLGHFAYAVRHGSSWTTTTTAGARTTSTGCSRTRPGTSSDVRTSTRTAGARAAVPSDDTDSPTATARTARPKVASRA